MMHPRPFPELPFVPLEGAAGQLWRRPVTYSFVETVRHVPIADSELLQTSHHLPVVVQRSPEGLQAVALVRPAFNRSSPVADDGRWRRAYMPIALRALPFRLSLSTGTAPHLEICPELGLVPSALEGTLLTSTKDQIQPDLQALTTLLMRFDKGHRRLNQAAERLLLAGILAEVPKFGSGGDSVYMTADPILLDDLLPERAAYLARDNFLPMDLIGACLFSRRLLPEALAGLAPPPGQPRSRKGSLAADLTGSLQNVVDLNVQVDDSELFSLDAFE